MSVAKTARHRSFSSSAETPTEALEPITFDLAGETFTANPGLQGIVLMDFLEASDGEGVSSIVAFKTFLKDTMEAPEYEKLDKTLRTSKEIIGIEQIAQIVAFLIEEYTSRPTKASAQ